MKPTKNFYFTILTSLVLALIIPTEAYLQGRVDSLEKSLVKLDNDSLQIKLLVDLCWEYRNSEPKRAIDYGNEAIEKALKYNDYENLVKVHSFIGVAYRILGNYSKSTDYYYTGLELSQKYKLTEQQGYAYINIANLHIYQEYYNTAIENLTRAMAIADEVNNKSMLSYVYLNRGRAYLQMKDYQKALSDFLKATEIRSSIQFNEGLPVCYKYLGDVYFEIENIEKAIENYNKSLIIVNKSNDKDLHASLLVKIADINLKNGRWNDAKTNAEEALTIAKEVGAKLTIRDALSLLYQISINSNDHKKASQQLVAIIRYNDTLFSQQLSEKIFFLEYQYEKQRKETEIDILNKEKTIQELSLQRANILNAALLIFLLLVTGMFVFVLFTLKQRKQKNSQLEKQYSEIQEQRENIEKKNKHLEEAYNVIEGYIGKMTDSIRYAKRIQDAVLPSRTTLQHFFTDHFYFHKPKDFVSGDFYWITFKNDTLYFAVADCTGHGVPGAFMSIIGLDLLNQAINQHNVLEPNEIVEFLNYELPRKLHLEQEELILKDSMDIALCSVNISNASLKYCGALIPFILVRDRMVIELKSDFASVGTSKKLFKKPFNQHTLQLQPNDWIYLFSDGFMDQIGGNSKKKYMRNNFIDTLIRISINNGQLQQDELERIFSSWKGNNEQIDDVLVLGLKV